MKLRWKMIYDNIMILLELVIITALPAVAVAALITRRMDALLCGNALGAFIGVMLLIDIIIYSRRDKRELKT